MCRWIGQCKAHIANANTHILSHQSRQLALRLPPHGFNGYRFASFTIYESHFPGDPLALPDPSFHAACQPPPRLILGLTATQSGNINNTPVVALVSTACPFVIINSTLANHLNVQVDPLPADTDVQEDGRYVIGIVGQTRNVRLKFGTQEVVLQRVLISATSVLPLVLGYEYFSKFRKVVLDRQLMLVTDDGRRHPVPVWARNEAKRQG